MAGCKMTSCWSLESSHLLNSLFAHSLHYWLAVVELNTPDASTALRPNNFNQIVLQSEMRWWMDRPSLANARWCWCGGLAQVAWCAYAAAYLHLGITGLCAGLHLLIHMEYGLLRPIWESPCHIFMESQIVLW
jgi:hypothetical protein